MPIPLFKVFIADTAAERMTETLHSGYITQGPRVLEFEENINIFLQTKRTLCLNSATAGLTLAMRLMIEPDPDRGWPGFDTEKDTVLTPTLTCFATTAAILSVAKHLQWIDVDPNTMNIDLDDLQRKLTPNTKVVYLVHWGGVPVDLIKLKQIQNEFKSKHGFAFEVVEDCAHSFGAEFNGKPLGNHGNTCVFSFQAIKHLTTSDGGAIALPDDKRYEKCKLLRWYGIDRNKRNYKGKDFRLESDISDWGYKFHMNDLMASLGLANLPCIPKLLDTARRNATYYKKELKNIKGLQLLHEPDTSNPAYWLFTMNVQRKFEYIQFMKSHGITVSQVHQRNDIHTCVEQYTASLPNMDKVEQTMVCIPVGWWVTEKDAEEIVSHTKQFFN
jgi:dTDP-4-amino-4,6-dideoxygalactose transaminase